MIIKWTKEKQTHQKYFLFLNPYRFHPIRSLSTMTTTEIKPRVIRRRSSLEALKSTVDEIDETVSRPIFRLKLPKLIEFVFSIPANFFGTTACLALGPLWVALASLSQEPKVYEYNVRILLLLIVTLMATTVYIIAWGHFQFKEYYQVGMKLFWNHWLYRLSYPWSVGILAYTVLGLPVTNSAELFSIAIYPLVLWPFVAFSMFELKNATRRSRPAKKDLERSDSEGWTQNKQFPATSHFLAKYNGDQSFPSGDVAMAVLIAIPFWYINDCKPIAVAIPLLSGLGRMYVLAHHVLDVICGALLTLGIHAVAFLLGYGMYQAEWWHPFLTLGIYAVFDYFKQTEFTLKNPEESKKE